ncbi:Junctional adhesion molecule-like [Anabarilius grahami]|uniref:Junctional adhesion molecule-like n=1 Tax=Anabarilius grahami TaxID=495550 RepID=A0A3N0Z8L9_ANAGA|nr:Junctional adhesion molecule-like [Anabarilius grahami]
MMAGVEEPEELRCVDSAIASVIDDIDSALILKEEQRTAIKAFVGFTVHGSSGPLVAPLGSSVVLPCHVDELLLMEGLEVEWRRTDSQTLVHLYQDGESRAEAQQQDYHGRAHFFTDQIPYGNFSLLLDNLRAEDEGKYTCTVSSQQDSGGTLVHIKDVEYLIASGSTRSASVHVGEDVTLNCSVDSHITPERLEEVSWQKTDEDILVLLYRNNQTLPDSSDEQYRDRVEFFTAEIPKGNFSLRLRSVRTEDKGVYVCQVFAGELSANATVALKTLGFSSLHVMVLVFCFAAGSGAVLLLCCLICCRSTNTVSSSTIWSLQLSLVFCPNICMSFAFIFWALTEVHLCNEIMYMFGAVGLVLLSSVALTAELILKARNDERVLKDLRFIVFPSEGVFALYWLILQMHAYCKYRLKLFVCIFSIIEQYRLVD